MNLTPRRALAGSLLALAVASLGGCSKGSSEGEAAAAAADAEKKAHEAAVADLKQPIALIAGYSPFARYPDPDKYFPARHPDLEKSTLCAANEIRYAANKARQKLEVSTAAATKDLQDALRAVTGACADAEDTDKLAKCAASVKALDASLEKTGAAAAALGVAGKYPRVAPDAVTEEAKTSMSTFLRARGPGPNEKAYVEKRADAKASPADVIAACETAHADAASAAVSFEKADEPIRLVAATRKMAYDSQCRRLGEIDGLRKDLSDCKKKPKSADCKVVCGKTKIWVEDGFPAAAFAPVAKDYEEICGKN